MRTRLRRLVSVDARQLSRILAQPFQSSDGEATKEILPGLSKCYKRPNKKKFSAKKGLFIGKPSYNPLTTLALWRGRGLDLVFGPVAAAAVSGLSLVRDGVGAVGVNADANADDPCEVRRGGVGGRTQSFVSAEAPEKPLQSILVKSGLQSKEKAICEHMQRLMGWDPKPWWWGGMSYAQSGMHKM